MSDDIKQTMEESLILLQNAIDLSNRLVDQTKDRGSYRVC